MKRLEQANNVVGFIPTVAHEFAHFAVASLVTDDAQMAVEVTGARARAVWPPIANPAIRAVAFLAPALWLPVIMGAWVLGDPPLVSAWTLLALGAALFTAPSPKDVRGALGLQDVQQEASES